MISIGPRQVDLESGYFARLPLYTSYEPQGLLNDAVDGAEDQGPSPTNSLGREEWREKDGPGSLRP